MTVENGSKSKEERNGGKDNCLNKRLVVEVERLKSSENEVTSSSDRVQRGTAVVAAPEKQVISDKEGRQPRLQKPVKDIRVVNLTKKIFASFPIKHEPCDSEDNETSKTEEPVKLPERLNEGSGSEVMMYISDEEIVYHAIRIDSQHEDIDKKSLYTENGVAYFIRPIKDDELCDLVVEYLELVKETPKGIFCIDITGNLLKEVGKDHCTNIEKEKCKRPEVQAAIEKPATETADQFEFQDDDQPDKTEVFIKPKTVQESSSSGQSRRKQDLRKLYEDRVAWNPQDKTKPVKPVLRGQGFGLKKPTTVTKKPDKDLQSIPKTTRRKRKSEKLIVDNKTDIPILELKMNMQVTHDIVNQAPQTAVLKKKAKTFDYLMQSPGKNIQSDKLLEIYNSRLVTNTASDSDDEGQGMDLPELSENAHRFTGWNYQGRAPEDRRPHKVCYL